MITTLLVEAAKSDDEFAEEEITKIKIVLNKLHFDEELTNSIFDKALEISKIVLNFIL